MKKQMILLCAAMVISGCTPKLVEQLPYYKLDVIQGSPMDAETIVALKPGMTREQVQLYLGTPLLRSSFRNDRWDYTYEISKGGKVKESRTLVVYFQGNMVSRIEGNAVDYARESIHNKRQMEQ